MHVQVYTCMHEAIIILQDDAFNISEGIDGSPTSFTITYSDQTANMICGQDTIPAAMFCEWNTQCIHEFNISSPSCSSSTAIIVSIFATNLLGNGPEVQFEVLLAGCK